MGRRKEFTEVMQARFPEGTFDRIQYVLASDEDRTAFVREAVERELRLRETYFAGDRPEEADRIVGVFTPQPFADPRPAPSGPPSRQEFEALVERVKALETDT